MKRLLSSLLGSLILTTGFTTMPASAAPRRPIVIRNEIASDASFSQFATKLNQAIRDRDAKYIQSILPQDSIGIGYGRPTKIADLKLGDPDSRFWGILEYTTVNGCGRSAAPNSKVWLCSTVSDDLLRQYPAPANRNWLDYVTKQVIVLGKNVNVRSQPSLNGRVITQLSNEVVNSNPKVDGIYHPNPLIGWTPVVLPDGKTGYVNNRYAYFALGYTLQVKKVNNQWQISQVFAGE